MAGEQSMLGKIQDWFTKNNDVGVPRNAYTAAILNDPSKGVREINPTIPVVGPALANMYTDYSKAGGGAVGVGAALRGDYDRSVDWASKNVIEPPFHPAQMYRAGQNALSGAIGGLYSGVAKGPEQAARDFQAQQAANHSDAAVGDPGSPKAPLPAAETNGALSYLGDPALPSKAPGQSAAETNGALSYLGNKSVEAGLANRTKGADLVANQGFTQVDNLQAAPGNYKGNPFFRKTTDLGNGMEEYKVEIPGKGWMTGVRKSDPNRQQGTFSVTPGLSDAERQQVAQIDANQARQAAYGVSRKTGELYDAAQQHQQQQAVLAALKQMQMQQEQGQFKATIDLKATEIADARQRHADTMGEKKAQFLTGQFNKGNEQQLKTDEYLAELDKSAAKDFNDYTANPMAGIAKGVSPWDSYTTNRLGLKPFSPESATALQKTGGFLGSPNAGKVYYIPPGGNLQEVPIAWYKAVQARQANKVLAPNPESP